MYVCMYVRTIDYNVKHTKTKTCIMSNKELFTIMLKIQKLIS